MLVGRHASIGFLCAALWLTGCNDGTSPSVDSQTHWLESCGNDASCNGLRCVCGVCTAPCAADGSCGVEGRTTSCIDASSTAVSAMCGAQPAMSLCLESCADDAACGARGRCVDGACIARAEGGSDGSGGAGGGGGVAGGSGSGMCAAGGESCGNPGPACCTGTCQIEACTNSIPGSCWGTCP